MMNRRGISRRVLARHAADQEHRRAACKGEWRLWDEAEKAHQLSRTRDEAAAAAAPAMALCAQCPVLDACAEWAKTDEYTGLAAGAAWVEGAWRDPGRVRKPRDPAPGDSAAA